MKHLLIFLTCLSLYGYSQPKLGMSTHYIITPTAAYTPTAGIPSNSSFTITTFVKNTGNAIFNGNVKAYIAVDSGAASLPAPIDSVSFANAVLNPGDSLIYTDTVTVSPAYFKSNGSGNTIVVWPVSSGIQVTDSFRIPIYVYGPSGIQELVQAVLRVYPNPAGDRLYIKAEKNMVLKSVSVFDIYMQKVMECSFTGSIDLSALKPGAYWIKAVLADKAYSALIIKRE